MTAKAHVCRVHAGDHPYGCQRPRRWRTLLNKLSQAAFGPRCQPSGAGEVPLCSSDARNPEAGTCWELAPGHRGGEHHACCTGCRGYGGQHTRAPVPLNRLQIRRSAR